MLKKIIILSLSLFAALSVCLSQSMLTEEVKSNVSARVESGLNPGIVIGIIDESGTQYYSAGVKSLKTKEPVNQNSVFEIGSITKTFTAILLADKVVKGEMKLDDPLQKYLPEGVNAPTRDGKSITLLQLSNHTSSLPRLPSNLQPSDLSNPYADYEEKQLFDFLNGYTLTREIGSQYEYSNYAVGLLGHILARKSGVSYEQLMIDVIAKPLYLANTRVVLTPEMKKNLAVGHNGEYEAAMWDLTALAGAGAIRSTASDMVLYLRANMGITKSKLYEAMQLTHKNSRAEEAKPKIGLGWHMSAAGDQEIVWHNGGTGGYRSFVGFVRGQNKGVVVLSNSISGIDDIGMHLLNPASPLKSIDKQITVEASVLDKYVGRYELTPAFILTVTRDGSQLNVQATGQQQFPVFAKREDVFFYKVVEAQLTFNKNADGVVESVTLNQAGQKLVGKKLAN